MSFTAQIQVPLEKQHTCVNCGCVFAYTVTRSIVAHGMSPAQAAANLPGCVKQQMNIWKLNPSGSVEKHPCPECGAIQPEMVHWRMIAHAVAAGVAFFSLLLLGAASGEWKETGSPSLRALAVTGLVLLGVLAAAHVVTLLWGSDRDRQANKEQARREMSFGKLAVVQPGRPEGERHQPRALTAGNLVPLALVVLAPLACAAGIVAHAGSPGPAVNPDLRPAVVSPGTVCNCFVPDLKLEGLGPWQGQPAVRVLNAKAVGAPEKLDAQGSNEPLGTEVKVYTMRGERPNNHRLRPTIRLTIPADASLAGEDLDLQVSMNMTYAFLNGPERFTTRTANVTSKFTVHVASAESLQQAPAFLVGLIAGGFASCLSGLWLVALARGPKGASSQLLIPALAEGSRFGEPQGARR